MERQLTCSAKLRAVFTRSFKILPEFDKRPPPHPAYDELRALTRYNVTWNKDGRKGKEFFKWRGTEMPFHLLVPSIQIPSFPVTSCSLAQRVDMIATIETDDEIRGGRLHALTTVSDQDTFYGMAINFVTWGTILPWAPCACEWAEDEDDQPQKKMPSWWEAARDLWDPIFRRAQVRSNLFELTQKLSEFR
jgi:hypothetical protein